MCTELSREIIDHLDEAFTGFAIANMARRPLQVSYRQAILFMIAIGSYLVRWPWMVLLAPRVKKVE
jgi:hypothetical protein